MNETQSKIDAILATCVLQKRHDVQDKLGLNWDEFCILAAVGLSADAGHTANISSIARLCAMPHSTASRLVHSLAGRKWIARVDNGQHPGYVRCTDPVKKQRLCDFLTLFDNEVQTVNDKLRVCSLHHNGESFTIPKE